MTIRPKTSSRLRAVLLVLSLCLLFVASCKRKALDIPSDRPEKQGSAAPASPSKAYFPPDLVPLDINLPGPIFTETPRSIVGVKNLEITPIPRPTFYIPEGTTNISLGKPVAASDDMPIIGEPEMITDGDKEGTDGSYVEFGPLLQHVTIDLGAEFQIFAVIVWHYHKVPRVYHDVVVQLADDPDFIENVKTLFNNDYDNSAGLGTGEDKQYIETYEGKLIDAKGLRGRHVRLYSNGNNNNDMNNYVEVEVYGLPAE